VSPLSTPTTNQMMADNPDMMKAAAEMMSSLPPDQIASMAAAQPGFTPEMARMAAEQVKSMSPDELRRMAQMAGAQAAGGGAPGMPSMARMPGMGGMPGGMPDPSKMDPKMMATAAEMIDKMSPEDLKAMMAAAGAANGMAMPELDPQMLKASMGMLKNMVRRWVVWWGGVGGGGADREMSRGQLLPLTLCCVIIPNTTPTKPTNPTNPKTPEDMAQMQSIAAAMGAGGAPPSTASAAAPAAASAAAAAAQPGGVLDESMLAAMMGGGGAAAGGPAAAGGGMPSMDQMMSQIASNPKMIEMSMKMMRDMDEESVVKVREEEGGGGGGGAPGWGWLRGSFTPIPAQCLAASAAAAATESPTPPQRPAPTNPDPPHPPTNPHPRCSWRRGAARAGSRARRQSARRCSPCAT